ncbi:restriction endonuclease subunit S [Neobacillus notoginsengisoli]|uniref:Restriction endonuclease subunit S n=2 Tax=Neobacillus notoginsengisoli TaxID=1578198 RepID=A0A417YTU2_9BACI|nr:restriction endonuclease subunit S [Neobacillus notoginsengisoli]
MLAEKTDPWSHKNLGELLEFKNGLNYRTGDVGEEVLIVGVSDFKDAFHVDETKLSTVTVESLPEDYLMNEGDFVFVRSNGNKELIGRVLFAKNISKKITHSGFTIRARNKSDLLLSEYCAIFCSSSLVKRQFMTKGGGSNISNLNQQLLSEIEIPLPSIPEQKKITSILSTWDKAIELKEKLIEQKKEQKKGLMQKLLMGHVRISDTKNYSEVDLLEKNEMIKRGEAPKGYKKTKIGIIPEDWKIVHLYEKFDRLTKRNIEGNQNVLTISAQYGLVNQESFFKKLVASENLTNYYLLAKGDFAYNKSYSNGYPFGAIKVLRKYESGIVSPLYICFSPKKNNYCPEYYQYYFESGLFNHEIYAIAQEGARNHGLLNVPVGDFFNLYVLDFDKTEMKMIAEIIGKSTEEVNYLELELEFLKQQKKGLMQNLLTGKIRVKV